MTDPRLLRRLDQVGIRLRRLRALWTATIGWSLLAVTLAVLLWLNEIALAWRMVFISIPVILLASLFSSRRRIQDRREAAILIERKYPQLDSRLLTAVQQQSHGHQWNFSFLQSELLTEVFSQLRSQNWHRAVGRSRLWKAHVAHVSAVAICGMLLLSLSHAHERITSVPSTPPLVTGAAGAQWKIEVEPGNIELERGRSLLVLAKFPQRLPGNVELVAVDEQAQEVRIPLQKSLDDPLYGGRLPAVEKDLNYHVEYDGHRSSEFHVTTFDYPALLRADAQLQYPDYTEIKPKKIEDVRRVTVVEGSSLNLECHLNKPVQMATLIDDDGQSIELDSDPKNGQLKTTHWSLTTPGEQRFKLHLVDEAGRTNREETEFRVTVVPNQTPDLKVTFPSKDLRVSALQELQLNAEASDDFGLHGLGLVYQTPTGTEETVNFPISAPADETAHADHLLSIEQLQVQPDDLLSYYFYAEDLGPDGEPRRSYSDIFFAEVRPFEEIFRQVPPQPGEGEGSSQGQKLLELQRQVVAGTWNVLRRERADSLSQAFEPDVRTLKDSQKEIHKFAETMRSRLRDPLLKQYAEEAVAEMKLASSSFAQGLEEARLEPVAEGRQAAQSAYQFLLKLQAREKQIQQSQSRGKSSSSSPDNRMDQQLQALKLKNDRDRYETERQAKAEQTAADQEALQVLERLKELARRQKDLNNRIRELENAVRNTEDPKQKEELRRQLQRLQTEQEELLRDLDNVRERMNEERNRQRMNEARKQTEQIRERVLQSSQALKEGQTSRALTEGTRAEQALHELEEDFRQQTAGQFNQAMRELREEVRKLANQEQQLADLLSEPETPASQRPSLRDAPAADRQSMVDKFKQQKADLQDVLDQTKKLVQDAETSEPLLSKKLYDTLREHRKHQSEEALDTAALLMQRGIDADVPQLEKQARKGIDQLQAGIESAAENILGNEEESLRLAQSELSQLTEAIRRELALNDPQTADSTTQPDGQKDSDPSKAGSSSSSPTKGTTAENDHQGEGGKNSKDSKPKGGTEQKNGTSQKPAATGNTSREESGKPGDTQKPRSQAEQQKEGQGKPGQGQSGQGQSKSDQNGQQGEGEGSQGQVSQGKQGAGSQGKGESGKGSQSESASGQSPLGGSVVDQLNQMLNRRNSENGSGTGPSDGPLTGESFRNWSDRMRDVEEMLTTKELRSQAAAVRDRARLERINVKRHSKSPDWELVRTSIYGPLMELEAQVAEELARRDPNQKLVPIDRDPVPEEYSKFVKSYFEQLSRKKGE